MTFGERSTRVVHHADVVLAQRAQVPAWARSAPTVHSALGRTENGSKRKWRIAFSWVIWFTSASGTSSKCRARISGAFGQVESEWG